MLNRVIKFRVWDEYRQELYCVDDFYYFEEQGIHNSSECNLMQFIGFLDMDGNEIYEGDIVQEGISKCEVEWGTFGWYPFEYCGGGELNPSQCKVIGNIYENPELVKNKNR